MQRPEVVAYVTRVREACRGEQFCESNSVGVSRTFSTCTNAFNLDRSTKSLEPTASRWWCRKVVSEFGHRDKVKPSKMSSFGENRAQVCAMAGGKNSGTHGEGVRKQRTDGH